MTNHMMLDLETLGTAPGSIILSIGAVVFDPYKGVMGETLYMNLTVPEQEAAGLTTSAATVAWWAEQSLAAKAQLSCPEPVHPLVALNSLADTYRACECESVWGHGATFDVVLLERLFVAFESNVPWRFSAARDTRTLFDLSKTEVRRDTGTHHYALDDAKRQAEAVCEAYHVLGQTKHDLLQRFVMAHRKADVGSYYNWSKP